MRKIINLLFAIACLSALYGCKSKKNNNTITFATSSLYQPFEFLENGILSGFDIDLAYAIGKELQKEVVFEDMQFSAVLPALQSGIVDAAISTITITESRKQNFDFSDPYYTDDMAMICKQNEPMLDQEHLTDKIIACQLGTTFEIWLKQHAQQSKILSFDNNNQAIEAVKAGHAHGVLLDKSQGPAFCKNNLGLTYNFIACADNGYGVALPKGSPLKENINKALKALKHNGTIQKLQEKWLGDAA